MREEDFASNIEVVVTVRAAVGESSSEARGWYSHRPTLAASIHGASWEELLDSGRPGNVRCIQTPGKMDLADMVEVRASLWEKYKHGVWNDADQKARASSSLSSIPVDGMPGAAEMQYSCEVIGDVGEGPLPLYICLHGGGGCSAQVNDNQWEQMKRYYKASVSRGVYLAPHGITENRNLHFEKESYGLYDRLIEDMVALRGADPNRVYLLGFSAGGDSVYQVAPRIADRLAASNMSAGHPNGASLTNLANSPIVLQCGALDTAYNRHRATAEYGAKLDLLEQERGRGSGQNLYKHECWLHVDEPHNIVDYDPMGHCKDTYEKPSKMDGVLLRRNTNAVHWVSQHHRNLTPPHVIWEVGCAADRPRPPGLMVKGMTPLQRLFYWLDISGSTSEESKIANLGLAQSYFYPNSG